jgi:hypothetical protein
VIFVALKVVKNDQVVITTNNCKNQTCHGAVDWNFHSYTNVVAVGLVAPEGLLTKLLRTVWCAIFAHFFHILTKRNRMMKK